MRKLTIQCTYNVTLRSGHATIVAVEKQWVLNKLSVCVYSFRYPACNAHVPYCYLWPAPLLQYLSVLSHKRHDFRKKKVTEHKMCVVVSSTTFVWNISHSEKKWERYDEKCTLVFNWSTSYSCPILMKFEVSRKILEKSSNTTFHENRSSGIRVVPCGRTDMTKLIAAFRKFCEQT